MHLLFGALPQTGSRTLTAILAIGSPYGADRIGWQIAEYLNKRGFDDVHSCRHPIDLLPYFQTCPQCAVVDALWADSLTDGQLIQLQASELKKDYCTDSHGMTLYEVMQLARISAQLPEQISIFGINISHRPNRPFSEAEVITLVDQLCTELTLR